LVAEIELVCGKKRLDCDLDDYDLIQIISIVSIPNWKKNREGLACDDLAGESF
jgi:hypothetical protein